nr:M23 family metallopeptidase [Croceicoccus hydrothermalis]
MRNTGVNIAARPFAPVIAPRAGEIAFAGAFRGHGMVVIIRHPARLTSVVAGLGELAVVPGQPVGRGALLGRVGGNRARIFYQMRRDGQPVDPLRRN